MNIPSKVCCSLCPRIGEIPDGKKYPSGWWRGGAGRVYCPTCADKLCVVDVPAARKEGK